MTIRIRTIVAALVLAALLAAAFVHTGVYNVAATEQHTAPVYHLLHYAMRRSVQARAADIRAPDLSDDRHARDGFLHYRAHCLQCHGAPGIAPNAAGFGTRPEPANLVEAAREWPAPEIFWVIKHGIKMTPMPAWAYQLSDEEIWDLTAFVKTLPALSPSDYQALDRAQPESRLPAVQSANAVRPGDPKAGRRMVDQYLCATCHEIPGVTGANNNVGPPLNGIGARKYIGGVLPNTPENMVRWLRDPQQVDPLSAMPNLRLREQEARDIAAYLYTLKRP